MKRIIAISVLVFIVAAWWVLNLLSEAGQFKTIEPHFNGSVIHVKGVMGAEDITISKNGIAFISSCDRRALRRGDPERTPGGIFAYDLNSPQPSLQNLTENLAIELHPHGLSLIEDMAGRQRLFVVNHRSDGQFIEVFDVVAGRLQHRKSLSHPLMHHPNDVVALDSTRFYVTNDHGNTSEIGMTLEEYLQLDRSYVLYFDGLDFKLATEGLQYANGINRSRDGRQIFVAATTEGRIYAYHPREDGTLNLASHIELNTGVDNIEVDEHGYLWVAAHPQLLTFVKHTKREGHLSPSQVLKIALDQEGHAASEEIFLSDGASLSGSSVAAVYRDKMLIGSVYDSGFLLCSLPPETVSMR